MTVTVARPVRLMFLDFTVCGRDAKTELAIEHGRRNDGRMRAAFWRGADRDTGVFPCKNGSALSNSSSRSSPYVEVLTVQTTINSAAIKPLVAISQPGICEASPVTRSTLRKLLV
jgi:hypothetical protein